jgi:hypothetical protein
MTSLCSGRITYYTQPPEDKSVVSTTICTELGEAFDINAKTFGGELSFSSTFLTFAVTAFEVLFIVCASASLFVLTSLVSISFVCVHTSYCDMKFTAFIHQIFSALSPLSGNIACYKSVIILV